MSSEELSPAEDISQRITFRPDENALKEQFGEKKLREMLQDMFIIRAFEEKAEDLFARGLVHGTMHLSIGQEATAVGASAAMHSGDYLLNHHRGHGHCYAWGGEINRMMAEFMGKREGYCRGRGGSMHIANVEMNNLGANGIVAGGIPISIGVGLSIKQRKTDQVCLTLFGDGAANEGAFHETMNMASIWDLPVVYLCENNQYAMSMAFQRAFNVERVSDRGCAYGIPGITVDGNDVFAVYAAVNEAQERARRGDGPTLVETLTYRWRGHSKSDRQAYRTREELKQWQERDPIRRFAAQIGVAEEELESFAEKANQVINAAVAFSDASAEPDPNNIMDGVYA